LLPEENTTTKFKKAVLHPIFVGIIATVAALGLGAAAVLEGVRAYEKYAAGQDYLTDATLAGVAAVSAGSLLTRDNAVTKLERVFGATVAGISR
jgi:hypothetical protein